MPADQERDGEPTRAPPESPARAAGLGGDVRPDPSLRPPADGRVPPARRIRGSPNRPSPAPAPNPRFRYRYFLNVPAMIETLSAKSAANGSTTKLGCTLKGSDR